MMNIHSHGDAMRRREEILRIVRRTPVHSQDELLAELRGHGFRVTQPTLSRDLRELGLVKTPAGAAQPLASAIDTTPLDDVLGTIGGDDTIFVAFRTPAAASAFARRIHDIAGLNPERRRTRA